MSAHKIPPQKTRVLETGVGIIIGRAFQDMIRSFVNDILVPPLSLLFGRRIVNLFWVLRQGKSKRRPKTIETALADGAITLNYGRFIHQVVNFLTVGASVYYFLKGLRAFFSWNALDANRNEVNHSNEISELCSQWDLYNDDNK